MQVEKENRFKNFQKMTAIPVGLRENENDRLKSNPGWLRLTIVIACWLFGGSHEGILANSVFPTS